jgi:hypothetical protein
VGARGRALGDGVSGRWVAAAKVPGAHTQMTAHSVSASAQCASARCAILIGSTAIRNLRIRLKPHDMFFSNPSKIACLRARFAQVSRTTNRSSHHTSHAFLIASRQILEIDLTRSQQTGKLFLIARFSALLGWRHEFANHQIGVPRNARCGRHKSRFTRHVPLITGHCPNQSLVFVVFFAIPHAFADPYKVTQHPDVDLVSICVRVPSHHQLGMAALNAGKHLYCEWPLAATTEQAQQMRDLAVRKGVHHMVGLQARGAPAFNRVRDLVAEGYVGRVLSCTMIITTPAWGIIPHLNGLRASSPSFCQCRTAAESTNSTRRCDECVHHRVVSKRQKPWQFAFQSLRRCWMRRNGSLRPTPAPGEAPPFSFARYFAFREVCIMKLSHFRGPLLCTNNGAFGPS